ncbi:MAG TPA: hypothetical protein DCP69_04985 [Candidatus Omnitrophica bacterium]|nr:hypothetical protein [Candidatus Omnitrophota bacterium]
MSIQTHCDATGCEQFAEKTKILLTHHLWVEVQMRHFCSWKCLAAWATACYEADVQRETRLQASIQDEQRRHREGAIT